MMNDDPDEVDLDEVAGQLDELEDIEDGDEGDEEAGDETEGDDG